MSYSTPTKHDGRAVLFAVAELLVLSGMKNVAVVCINLVINALAAVWAVASAAAAATAE